MHERRATKYRPDLERLEAKRPLSAGASSASLASVGGASAPSGSADLGTVSTSSIAAKPEFGFLVYRITNPNPYNDKLAPPSMNVRVQTRQPIPGQTYNILFITVRNGTSKTFDAGSGFEVKFPGDKHVYPILTGDQQWKPGQVFVFYVLSKKYYPLPSQVHSGFEFSLEGARSVAIPGPSGIFLRVKYDPATFDRTLDQIVMTGPGAQGGKGFKYGLPVTSIYEFLPSTTNRKDFGGYF